MLGTSEATEARGPGLVGWSTRSIVFALLRRIRVGFMTVQDELGREHAFGDPASAVRAKIRIHDRSFYWDVLSQGSWGLGWSFVRGGWSSPSSYRVVVLLLLNESVFRPYLLVGGLLSPAMRKVEGWATGFQDHSPESRRDAIGVSYDVGNDFFRWMLGPSMIYTGGIWEADDESLEDAQENKLRRVVEKARIEGHHRVLDIGCGWGTLCNYIQREIGAEVKGISLSANQLEWARRAAPGCDFELRDYRDVGGRFDRIVSVGMAEHVGRQNFPEYMSRARDLLAPGGRFVLDTMVGYDGLLMASNRRRWTSFASVTMPNADVPSMTDIVGAAMRTGEMRVLHTETFGAHYARTCEAWQENLERARDEICRAYSEEIFRIYEHSWDLARASLETGMSQVQVVLERAPYGTRIELAAERAR